MNSNSETNNNIRLDKDTIFGGTLLQVDSTVVIGVLFFLTLNSYLAFLPTNVGRFIIGCLTISAIIPFVISAFLIIRNERSKQAILFTMWGFVYLALILIVTLVLPLVADQIPTLPVLESTAEKCVKNPNDFNVTHKWQCSLFSG
ncbi:MAG TPA: hypothetical protein VH500_18575, partial [Nitrososphaeraceae archaeon]